MNSRIIKSYCITNITTGKFTKEDVEERRVNLLFFGNFHQMDLKEYEWALQEMVKDKDYVYSSLTKDLYYLGVVLNRKYKILRITYNIFMIGMIISVISFGIAFRFFGPDRLIFWSSYWVPPWDHRRYRCARIFYPFDREFQHEWLSTPKLLVHLQVPRFRCYW